MIDVAFAQGQGRPDPTGAILFQVLFLVGIFAIFYFLIIRPQKKERERHASNLPRGVEKCGLDIFEL